MDTSKIIVTVTLTYQDMSVSEETELSSEVLTYRYNKDMYIAHAIEKVAGKCTKAFLKLNATDAS